MVIQSYESEGVLENGCELTSCEMLRVKVTQR